MCGTDGYLFDGLSNTSFKLECHLMLCSKPLGGYHLCQLLAVIFLYDLQLLCLFEIHIFLVCLCYFCLRKTWSICDHREIEYLIFWSLSLILWLNSVKSYLHPNASSVIRSQLHYLFNYYIIHI